MIHAIVCDESGRKVRWQDWGTGAPLVLLPGLSFPVALNLGMVAAHPALPDRRKILIDYPGSGYSDWRTDCPYTLSLHAQAVLAVIRSLGLGPVDVFGYSMGGTVAIMAALEDSAVFNRLIVAEANVEPGGGGASLAIARQGRAAFLSEGYDRLINSLAADTRPGYGPPLRYAGWRDADPAALFDNAAGLVDLPDDFFAHYTGLPVPRAFLYGGRNLGGGPTPDTPEVARLERAGIQSFVVPDAGHSMMFDNLPGFMSALVAALDIEARQT
ncbi:MAG: alpha/beta hydrolase [Pseudomonadota bacterium]